jgi:hypothetical protein
MFVMAGIVEYLERYPDTEVSAVFLDRIVNLLEEGLDVSKRGWTWPCVSASFPTPA